jgi:phosphonate transport system substrate-binding protein
MKKITKSIAALVILLLCNVSGDSLAQGAKKEKDPEKLIISIEDNKSGERVKAIQPIAEYLSKELKIKIEARSLEKAVDVNEHLSKGTVHLGVLNTFGYVLATSENIPITPLVVPGRPDGSPSSYNSCIFSAKSKGISSMNQLIKGGSDYSFMFVNATSTSGHLVPRLYFSRHKIPQAEDVFKEILFGDNHYLTIEKVAAGEVDAGATAYNVLESFYNQGRVNPEDIEVLWKSDDITQSLIVASNTLSEKLQKRIQEALMQLHKKDPALWKHIQNNFSAHDATNYIVAKDSFYDGVRNISENMEDFLFILNFYLD